MNKKIFLILLVLSLVSCGKQEFKKEDARESTTKVEEKKEESNTVYDTIDHIQKGDLAKEKADLLKFKEEIYKTLDYVYSMDAEHNKGKTSVELNRLRKYDKYILDSNFKEMEEIISKCETENRFFRESEMKSLEFKTSEITKLTNKWTDLTK